MVDGDGNLKGLITVKDIQKMIEYPRRLQGRARPAARRRRGRRFGGDYLERARGAGRGQGRRAGGRHRRTGTAAACSTPRRGCASASRTCALMVGNVATAEGARAADRARRRRGQGRHRPGLDLHHARRHRRRRAADHRHPGLRARRRRARHPGDRRRRHQVLRRHHQGARRRRRRGDDRLAVRRHRGEPGRDDPLRGPHLQGLPRHGLAVGDGARQRRPLLPGRRHGALASWCPRASRAWCRTRAASTTCCSS